LQNADNDKEVLFLFKIDSEKNESANWQLHAQALAENPKIYPPSLFTIKNART
jgi:hypothetical protein